MGRQRMRDVTMAVLALVLMLAVGGVALAGCSSSDAEAQPTTVGLTKATSLGSSGSSSGNRVRYGRVPDSDELLVIRTASNQSTAYGQVPVTGTSSPQPLVVFLSGFETSRQVFIAVDGQLVGMYDPAEKRVEITLSEAQLARGVHSVEATQHAGDVPTATTTLYKCCQYAVEG